MPLGPSQNDFTRPSGTSPLSNFSATTDPTVNDGELVGYTVGSQWINTITDEAFILTDASAGAAVWALTSGATSAVSGNERNIFVDFDYTSPSPFSLGNLAVGDAVLESEIEISVPFDGAGAGLRLGTVADPDLIFAFGEANPKRTACYSNDGNFVATATEMLRLIIDPGVGATQGSGRVAITIRDV